MHDVSSILKITRRLTDDRKRSERATYYVDRYAASRRRRSTPELRPSRCASHLTKVGVSDGLAGVRKIGAWHTYGFSPINSTGCVAAYARRGILISA